MSTEPKWREVAVRGKRNGMVCIGGQDEVGVVKGNSGMVAATI